MLKSLLFSQVFTYCTGNPIYQAPNGKVVQFQHPVEMVNITHTWSHHKRDAHRVNGWVEVFPADGEGNWIVDADQSFWMRVDGCWGEQVGV